MRPSDRGRCSSGGLGRRGALGFNDAPVGLILAVLRRMFRRRKRPMDGQVTEKDGGGKRARLHYRVSPYRNQRIRWGFHAGAFKMRANLSLCGCPWGQFWTAGARQHGCRRRRADRRVDRAPVGEDFANSNETPDNVSAPAPGGLLEKPHIPACRGASPEGHPGRTFAPTPAQTGGQLRSDPHKVIWSQEAGGVDQRKPQQTPQNSPLNCRTWASRRRCALTGHLSD